MKDTANKRLFISVGTRFSMNRLLNNVDDLMEKYAHFNALAQIGRSSYQSKNFQTTNWIESVEFEQAVAESDVFISHAGMGNILLAAKYQKPIIIMPRRADLGEHINDHQITTAQALANKPFIEIANTLDELEQAILKTVYEPGPLSAINEDASNDNLITSLKKFIDGAY